MAKEEAVAVPGVPKGVTCWKTVADGQPPGMAIGWVKEATADGLASPTAETSDALSPAEGLGPPNNNDLPVLMAAGKDAVDPMDAWAFELANVVPPEPRIGDGVLLTALDNKDARDVVGPKGGAVVEPGPEAVDPGWPIEPKRPKDGPSTFSDSVPPGVP